MKSLFFNFLLIACILPINGMVEVALPESPVRTIPAAAPTLPFPEMNAWQINELKEVAHLTYVMITQIRKRFATKDLTKTVNVSVSELIERASSLIPLFIEFFQKVDSQERFTPGNKKDMEKHITHISGLSPKSFVRCSEKDFEASVNVDHFPFVLETHNENIAYIPQWFIDWKFALYKNTTAFYIIQNGALQEVASNSTYNFLRMLKGDNPESLSGIVDNHHLFQTSKVFTPVCYSFHKKEHKALHRAKGKSLINRSECTSDFYYTNKYVAGIQILKIIKVMLDYNEEVYDVRFPLETKHKINAILSSPGNVDIIPNTLVPKPADRARRSLTEIFNDRASPTSEIYDRTDVDLSVLDSSSYIEEEHVDSGHSNGLSPNDHASLISEISDHTDGSFDSSMIDSSSDGAEHSVDSGHSNGLSPAENNSSFGTEHIKIISSILAPIQPDTPSKRGRTVFSAEGEENSPPNKAKPPVDWKNFSSSSKPLSSIPTFSQGR